MYSTISWTSYRLSSEIWFGWNTENGEEGNEVNKARFRLLYFVVNAFLWQDSVKQDALNEVKHNV